MNPQQEFMSETFHTLAQPITALRATVELGLCRPSTEPATQELLQSCLSLIDRLMQDLAVFREIASIEDEPPRESCDGEAMIAKCAEEMMPVAESCGARIRLQTEPAMIHCNQKMFERGIFVLLDEMLAHSSSTGEISISLSKRDDKVELALRPGTRQGQRQKLCSKLMRFAGGMDVCFTPDSSSVTFRENTDRHIPELSLVNKSLLTSH